jgi:thiol-disulfide isomerase/thioredoxin
VQDSDHKVTLSQFRGQVVVLNFWATWCPPCIEETPSMVQMQARLKDKGVVVLAVSIDADDAAYHKFLKDYSVNMVTVRDEARSGYALRHIWLAGKLHHRPQWRHPAQVYRPGGLDQSGSYRLFEQTVSATGLTVCPPLSRENARKRFASGRAQPVSAGTRASARIA